MAGNLHLPLCGTHDEDGPDWSGLQSVDFEAAHYDVQSAYFIELLQPQYDLRKLRQTISSLSSRTYFRTRLI